MLVWPSRSVGQCWGKEDPAFPAGLGAASSDLSTCIPLSFHEDGVPNWHDSTATFISFSRAWRVRAVGPPGAALRGC